MKNRWTTMMANSVWARAASAMILGLVLAVTAALPAFAAVVVTVNGTPVTDLQVSQRIKLFTMEGNRTGQRGALDQLIDEAIMMTEAKRLNISVSNAQIDSALLDVARNVKLSQDKLVQMLQSNGVGMETLRDRLRSAIAWSAVTDQAIMPQVQISDLALDQQAAGKIADYQKFDYILKEIIFIAPGGQGAGARTAQANRYRSSFAGCDSAVQLSLAYNDAAVLDVGRRNATQLPEAVAKELAGLNVGGISKPRTTSTGVSMLAICQKTQAQDLTFIKGDLRQEAGNDALKDRAGTYLADLRKSAKIIYN
jgi:peptidyl-prolyl cis-trans isomerase SurA